MLNSWRKQLFYFLLVPALLASFVCLAYPLYVIRPFRHQGPRELAAALAILQIRPVIAIVCAVAVLAGLAWFWSVETRRWQRILAAVGAALVCVFAALSRVNVYELMFHPDTHPQFGPAAQAKVDADDKVLAVKLNGSARAYPIRSIAYHHVINDFLGREPIVATY